VRHSAAAINFGKDGKPRRAARRHVLAAEAHEAAGIEALRNGDGGGSEVHHEAAALHRKAASMHLAGVHDEPDEDEEVTTNLVVNEASDDVLDLPEVIHSSRPAGRGLTVNLRGTVEEDDDCLPLPEPAVLYNYACDAEAARAVFNAQASQPPLHSWDGGVAGSVEQGGVRLGTTAGNPQYGDRIDPKRMTPEEMLEYVGAHDFLTRENRKRMGLDPESDVDVSDVLEEPNTIGRILGEMGKVKKPNQQ